MFTGLIEEVGTVAHIQTQASGSRLTINARTVLEGVKLGDSIAIDGVCTTVIEFSSTSFTIEASPETLRKSTFKNLSSGKAVNLERPLTPVSRLGGHYVTGHVDGLAQLLSKQPEGLSVVMTFELQDKALSQLLVAKGSIAINGISLTLNTVEDNRFSVAIIPHTLTHTNLGAFAIGDWLNIETDILGKYVKKLLAPVLNEAESSQLDTAFLQDHGFIPLT